MLLPVGITSSPSKAALWAMKGKSPRDGGALKGMYLAASGIPAPPPGYVVKVYRLGTFTWWVFYRKVVMR